MFNVITFRGWKNMHGFKELKLEMTKLRKQMMSVLSKYLQSRKETVRSCTIFLSFFFLLSSGYQLCGHNIYEDYYEIK